MSPKTEPLTKNRFLRKNLEESRDIIRSLKARQDEKRTRAEKMADFMTSLFGSIPFLLLNVVWFVTWFILNLNLIPGIKPFDPFPFGLLTMIVSLEAIVLAIFVLISQNRSSKIADLREEIDLQVDMLTERELTKLMHLVCTIAEKQGINTASDQELQTMLEPTSMSKIEHALEQQVIGADPREPLDEDDTTP